MSDPEEPPMQPRTIAILSPGNMGGGVGADLAERGFACVVANRSNVTEA